MQIVPSDIASGGALGMPLEYAAPEDRPVSPLTRMHGMLRGRYRYAIALALVLGAVGGVLGYRSTEPKYESHGLLNISPTRPEVLSATDQNQMMPMFGAFVESQVSLILSRRTIDLAMQNPDWQALGKGLSEQAVADFTTQIKASQKGSQMIEISYLDRDPKVAMIAVRSVVQAYQKVFSESDAQSDVTRLQALQDLRQNLTNSLKSINDRIQAIVGEAGSYDALAQTYSYKLTELNRVETEYKQAEMNLALAEAIRNRAAPAATQQNFDEPALQTPEEIAPYDQQMRDLLRARNEAEGHINDLRPFFADNHPTMFSARRALEIIKERIAKRAVEFRAGGGSASGSDTVTTGPSTPNASLEELRRREIGLRAFYERAKTEVQDLGRKDQQIGQLRSDADAVQRRLDEAKTRLERLNLESVVGGRISIFSSGDQPLTPAIDKRKSYASLGGFLGVFAGFGIVLLIGFSDRRVKNLADMEDSFRNPQRLLGILPTLPDDLADPEQAAFAAHCVHRIRTMLEVGAGAGRRRVLTVTSPMPGDGKTSLTLALGLSFAAADSKTLLIDCDVVGGGLTSRMKAIIRRKMGEILRRQGLLTQEQFEHALAEAQNSGRKLGETIVELGYLTQTDIDHALVLQKESAVGLLDVLDGAPLEECITGSGTPGLWILPLGSARAQLTGQISPKAIRRIVEEARALYDVTLIDTGPLLGSLETSVITSESDEVILAVARGEQRPLVEKAIEMLRTIGARLAGLVYNRARAEDIEASEFSPSTRMSVMRSQPLDLDPDSAPKRASGSSRLGPVAGAVVSSTTPQEEPRR
jgi:Mrp family chromosome partitioning ATPase/uncharacterized protein involved in exopolysaccharide biosynthesis